MIINKKPYTIERQAFPFIKEIQWSHVEQQRLMEEEEGPVDMRGDTTLLTECGYSESGLLNDVLNQMMKYGYNSLHIYYSKLKEAKTGGKHADGLDVLIVQSYGRMKYIINDDEIILNPTDSVFIPAGIYHEGVHIEPRITCSFANYLFAHK
tara:strand:- start:572 stop:1027 length:456 start_codon:yes stop_codon:yes gene_type:complete